MQHLWASEHVGDEHACEVHISNLRRKIERDPSQPERLVTVRGLGLQARRGVSLSTAALRLSRHPIVQAPMANNAAAGAGGGGLARRRARVDRGRDAFRRTSCAPRSARCARRPIAPFGVNLFAPPYLREDALEVVLEERPAVFSFTFGAVDPAPLHDAGIVVLGTATTAEEARALDRRAWTPSSRREPRRAATAARSSTAFRSCRSPSSCPPASMRRVPVVAAGGIVDGAGIARDAASSARQACRSGRRSSSRPSAGRPREHLDALRTLRDGRHRRIHRPPMRAARDAGARGADGRAAAAAVPEQRSREVARATGAAGRSSSGG